MQARLAEAHQAVRTRQNERQRALDETVMLKERLAATPTFSHALYRLVGRHALLYDTMLEFDSSQDGEIF